MPTLDTVGRSLVCRLDNVPSTELDIVVSYYDLVLTGGVITSFLVSTASVPTNGTSLVTVLDAPGDGHTFMLTDLAVCNTVDDQTFMLFFDDEGLLIPYKEFLLSSGDNLEYSRNGWRTLDAFGNLKVTGAAGGGQRRTSIFGSVDTLLGGTVERTTNVDTLLKALGRSVTGSVDTWLAGAITITGTVDTLLKGTLGITGPIDTYLANRGVITDTIDTYLLLRPSVQGTVDTILSGQLAVTDTVDTFLVNQHAITGTIDTLLKATLGVTDTADTILRDPTVPGSVCGFAADATVPFTPGSRELGSGSGTIWGDVLPGAEYWHFSGLSSGVSYTLIRSSDTGDPGQIIDVYTNCGAGTAYDSGSAAFTASETGSKTITGVTEIWIRATVINSSYFNTNYTISLLGPVTETITGTVDTFLAASGPPLGSIVYNGSNQSVSVAYGSPMNVGNTCTLSGWCYPTSVSGNRVVMAQRTSCGLGFNWQIYGVLGGGAMLVTGNSPSWSSSGSLTINAWNNVVVTNDGSTVKIYLNGSLDTTASASNSFGASNVGLTIGNESCSAWFQGNICDLRMYSDCKNSTDVATIHSNPFTNSLSNLVGWWPCGDGSGTTALDWSGHSNNGTLINSPTWSGSHP